MIKKFKGIICVESKLGKRVPLSQSEEENSYDIVVFGWKEAFKRGNRALNEA